MSVDEPTELISIGPVRGPNTSPQGVSGVTQRDRSKKDRSPSGARLEGWIPSVIAIVVSLPALVAPLAGLAVVFAGSTILSAVTGDDGVPRRSGVADVAVIPAAVFATVVGRMVGFFSIARLIVAPVRIGGRILMALGVPAVLAGVPWVLTRGSEALEISVRSAIVYNSPTVFAFLVCVAVARGLGTTRNARDAYISKQTEQRSEGLLTVVAALAGMMLAVVGLLGPGGSWAPFASGEDFVAAVPLGLDGPLVDAQESLTQSRADVVADCINEEIGYSWTGADATDRSISLRSDARFSSNGVPEISEILTAALALANQAPPWVETVEVSMAAGDLDLAWRIDISNIRRDVPIEDVDSLIEQSSGYPLDRLRSSSPNEGRALLCGSRI